MTYKQKVKGQTVGIQERDDSIMRLLLAGIGSTKIAQHMGMTISEVRVVMRANGHGRKHMNPVLRVALEERDRKIAAAYAEHPATKVAHDFGITVGRVYQILQANRVPARRPRRSDGKYHPQDIARAERMVDMRKAGDTLWTIAQKFDITPARASQILGRMGVQPSDTIHDFTSIVGESIGDLWGE